MDVRIIPGEMQSLGYTDLTFQDLRVQFRPVCATKIQIKMQGVIDLWSVVANSLWILGLAVTLAALSWGYWAASTEETQFRVVLDRLWLQRVVGLGLALFCVGLAATGRAWWERFLWALLAVLSAVQTGLVKRGRPVG